VKFLPQQFKDTLKLRVEKGAWHSSHHLKVVGFCATNIYENGKSDRMRFEKPAGE